MVLAMALVAPTMQGFMDKHSGKPTLVRGTSGRTNGMELPGFMATGEVEGAMISEVGGLEATSDKQNSSLPMVIMPVECDVERHGGEPAWAGHHSWERDSMQSVCGGAWTMTISGSSRMD
jgi:hypothetical protein